MGARPAGVGERHDSREHILAGLEIGLGGVLLITLSPDKPIAVTKRNRRSATPVTPSAIASDLSWLPDMVEFGKPALSAEAYIKAYLADPDEWYWSTILLHDPKETVLQRVLAIIEQAKLPGHEKALGQLGVGPLEDMMSSELLDHLHHWLPFSPAMRYALNLVRMPAEHPSLQQRLNVMLLR